MRGVIGSKGRKDPGNESHLIHQPFSQCFVCLSLICLIAASTPVVQPNGS